mmetsp:Transcript_27478/g.40416  ORF Transcript_27478/g.40416 Transcript_27478/m.40416 type:complete len:85 (-) Transcript_27478:60-314(-)
METNRCIFGSNKNVDSNPIALLQISIPAVHRVFLVDTHILLRPNLNETMSMTTLEPKNRIQLEPFFNPRSLSNLGFLWQWTFDV